jgi:hypothetical protein
MMTHHRISLWSGPRHVATALMYAFAQRPDTHIIDEPFYAHYLRRTGVPHPGRERVLARQSPSAQEIIEGQLLAPMDLPVRFVKQMTHHLVGIELDFLRKFQHVMLLRDPRQVLPSLQAYVPSPTLLDTAYQMQYRLYDYLIELGLTPLLIQAETLRLHPEATIRKICDFTGLTFQPHMLCWPPGDHPEEGVWGQYWYQTLHRSNGFMPLGRAKADFPAELEPLLEQCSHYYLPLAERALQAEHIWLPQQQKIPALSTV